MAGLFRAMPGARILGPIHAIILLGPFVVAGDAAFASNPPAYSSDAPAFEDGLMVTGEGPNEFLPGRKSGANTADVLKFGVDSCGLLDRVQSKRSIVQQSALEVDPEDYDDDEDPSTAGEAMISGWLSEHSEIAVMRDSIDNFCADMPLETDDEDAGYIA